MENARKQYAFDMGSALKGALRELRLDRAKVAFDDMGFGLRLGIDGIAVADGYDPMMFARSIKPPVELDLIRRATRLNETAIRKTIGSWQKGATWRDLNVAPTPARWPSLAVSCAIRAVWAGAIRAARTRPSCFQP